MKTSKEISPESSSRLTVLQQALPSMSHSPFFMLPLELRFEIYSLLLVRYPDPCFPDDRRTGIITHPFKDYDTFRPCMTLFRTNRQINQEAATVLYQQNVLVISHPSTSHAYRRTHNPPIYDTDDYFYRHVLHRFTRVRFELHVLVWANSYVKNAKMYGQQSLLQSFLWTYREYFSRIGIGKETLEIVTYVTYDPSTTKVTNGLPSPQELSRFNKMSWDRLIGLWKPKRLLELTRKFELGDDIWRTKKDLIWRATPLFKEAGVLVIDIGHRRGKRQA